MYELNLLLNCTVLAESYTFNSICNSLKRERDRERDRERQRESLVFLPEAASLNV